MQRQMFDAVDEVIDVAAKEGIEADIVKDGVLHVATNAAQERRLLARRPQLAHEGWGAADLLTLGQEALTGGSGCPGPASRCGARTPPASTRPGWCGGWPTPSRPWASPSTRAPR